MAVTLGKDGMFMVKGSGQDHAQAVPGIISHDYLSPVCSTALQADSWSHP